jgi:hypothetical protein
MDGGTIEYIFETDEQDVPKTVSKERAAEIAADFVTTFYHAQIGALETQEFQTQPVLHSWLNNRPILDTETARIDTAEVARKRECRTVPR